MNDQRTNPKTFHDHTKDGTYREIRRDGSWRTILPNGITHTGSSVDQDDALARMKALHDEFVLAVWDSGEKAEGFTRTHGRVGNCWVIPLGKFR